MNYLKKINYLLNKKDKKSLFFLFLLMLCGSFLDLIGVSAILPIVSLLTAPSAEISSLYHGIISFFVSHFKLVSNKDIVLFLIVFLSIFYLFKGLYMIFLRYCTSKFSMAFNRKTSVRMIKAYLSMPYEYHLEHNSSTLLRSATYDVQLFVSAMNSVLSILLNASTTLLLLAYLIYNDVTTQQYTTIIVGGVIAVISFGTVYLLKKHLKSLSYIVQEKSSKNYKYINQAFNGIKESKISNKELYFANMYEDNVISINHYQIRKGMYEAIPPVSLETFGLISLLVALSISILTKVESEYPSVVANFSVLALSTIKLLPATNQINAQLNSLSYSKVSVDLLYKDIKESEKTIEFTTMNYNNVVALPYINNISLDNICFKYKGSDNPVLREVSLKIRKGESIAISGKSGEGKTTLVDIILGLLKPYSGAVYCDDKNIESNIRGWHENLSYIPQNIYLMDDTIRRNVAFGYNDSEIDDRKVWDSLQKAELSDYVKSLPAGLDTSIGERGIRMSGGQRQRVGIARAFYKDSDIIIFDEATSALDYDTEKSVLEHVNKFKGEKTLIIITHRLNTIESCDHIYRIDKGKVTLTK